MFKRSMVSMAALFALSGCLGGGGGSSSSVSSLSDAASLSNSVASLSSFADNGGVAAGNATDDDDGSVIRVIILGPQISETVSAINAGATDPNNNDLTFENVTATQTLSDNSIVQQGTDTFNGATVDFRLIIDSQQEAFLGIIEDPTSSVGATGFALGAPLSGSLVGAHTFTGTLAMGERGPISNIDMGSFTMAADFGANSYTFTGATNGGDTLNGSGAFNLQTGTFTASNFTAVTSGTNRDATVFGQLHGNGGTSVSGVFHTNEATPTHHGGFVGSR